MPSSRSRPSWLSTMFALLTILSFTAPANALYFYMKAREQKCFYEEMPKDTLVIGHYKAEILNPNTNTYGPDASLSIVATIEEVFDNDHRVMNQRGTDVGRFTFTAADSGLHKVCFTPDAAGKTGWIMGSGGNPVKMTLDIAIGETSKIESEDKGKLEDMAQRVKSINARLQDIRREQVFQREREAQFRDQSEATNGRVVRWTIMQLVILSLACAWQLSHLRSFFIKQKLT
ncbi:hypothetical protein AJ80_00758 [Polytolypa hystricis UAMH7299]|uniref:GOLD domain-containing protein n=1 Tax=Polytolypa hystricis (strain UAMH7299) TaxID=1447883 RepID=A0A2B7Z3W4_POLH7|nr:hypothetical protein AJ80_00758 [Polytolypa hystricis UAMH7299]